MVRVAVQSKLAKQRVAKLTYQLRGPYEIVDILEHGAYNLRKFGKPESAKLKYHAEDISMLPPAIRPVEPLDGPDLRYLNNAHAPIPHPLKQAFDIKLYNDVWFSQPIDAVPPRLLRNTNEPPLISRIPQHTPEHMSAPMVTADADFHVVNQHPVQLQ
jgi:hypothetical protein